MKSTIELFRPKNPMFFTGERLTTSMPRSQIEAEHLHRYLLSSPLCKGNKVLDVASGEGYGSRLISEFAEIVIGLEIDKTSVAHANSNYAIANKLYYVCGDATSIPFGSNVFDIITSFETIEHIVNQDFFLREINRVLKSDGILIMSSPDRNVYSKGGHTNNPYHVNELSLEELKSIVSSYFSNIQIFRQFSMIGSVISNMEPNSDACSSYFRQNENEIVDNLRSIEAPYLIVVASNRNIELPNLSILNELPEYGFILTENDDLRKENETVSLELEKLNSQIVTLQKIAEDRKNAILHLEGLINKLKKVLE